MSQVHVQPAVGRCSQVLVDRLRIGGGMQERDGDPGERSTDENERAPCVAGVAVGVGRRLWERLWLWSCPMVIRGPDSTLSRGPSCASAVAQSGGRWCARANPHFHTQHPQQSEHHHDRNTHHPTHPTRSPHGVRSGACRCAATKRYGSGDAAVTALDAVSVDFNAHQFTAIMGPSGSGKSTLMHLVAGLDTLTSGSVFIGDTDLSGLDDAASRMLRRDKIGFIFQAYNLVPTLTALENITLPTTLAGRKPDKEWLDHVVHTVGLSNRLKHRPTELSRRPAAARRRRPGAGQPAGDHLR